MPLIVQGTRQTTAEVGRLLCFPFLLTWVGDLLLAITIQRCFGHCWLLLQIEENYAALVERLNRWRNPASYASAMPAQRESEETEKLHHRSQIADTSNWLFPIEGPSETDHSRLPAVCLTISISKVRW
jgi:hypothetical protein